MTGHQATKRMATCCVPNGVGESFLAKSMTVLNEARKRMKKKTLPKTNKQVKVRSAW
jgi:hypothetical protein